VSEKFGAGFNFISKSASKEKDNASWNGSALYLNYAFSPGFILAARGELINDKDGVIAGTTDNTITAFTFSGNIKIDAFTIIPEVRFDSAKKDSWVNDKGVAKKNETSFILAAVYKF
jgi:Putative beta-barrel porin-2, OmpL-like. bbp2